MDDFSVKPGVTNSHGAVGGAAARARGLLAGINAGGTAARARAWLMPKAAGRHVRESALGAGRYDRCVLLGEMLSRILGRMRRSGGTFEQALHKDRLRREPCARLDPAKG
jgi:hypothetical protein